MTEQLAIGIAQVPLHEHLRRIPRHAILQWENPSKEPWDLAFSSAPVGLLAHQAADALDPASGARQPSVSDLRDANNRAHDRKVRLSAALIRLVEHFERVDASEHDKAAIKAATDVGRAATWLDALEHCPEPVKAAWRSTLIGMGVDIDDGKITPERRS